MRSRPRSRPLSFAGFRQRSKSLKQDGAQKLDEKDAEIRQLQQDIQGLKQDEAQEKDAEIRKLKADKEELRSICRFKEENEAGILISLEVPLTTPRTTTTETWWLRWTCSYSGYSWLQER